MSVEVRYYTDPACTWSWGAEPKLRRLMWEFEGQLDFIWVMEAWRVASVTIIATRRAVSALAPTATPI